jgi:hypothetical protein
MVKRALDVPKDSFDQQQVLITRVVHVEAYLLHGISDVGARERQVLEGTSKTSVLRRIGDRRASLSGELGRCVHGSRRRVAGAHASTLEYLESVLSLREKHPLRVTSNGKAEEVMKLAQVSHGELGAEGGDDSLE